MNSDQPIKPDWKWGTPEGSPEFDRLMDRRLSFREILEWQEEAETLSLHLQSQRQRDTAKHWNLNDAPPQKTDVES